VSDSQVFGSPDPIKHNKQSFVNCKKRKSEGKRKH